LLRNPSCWKPVHPPADTSFAANPQIEPYHWKL
jgi:hypothetical protein